MRRGGGVESALALGRTRMSGGTIGSWLYAALCLSLVLFVLRQGFAWWHSLSVVGYRELSARLIAAERRIAKLEEEAKRGEPRSSLLVLDSILPTIKRCDQYTRERPASSIQSFPDSPNLGVGLSLCQRPRLLVTGCGRSGTHFMAEALGLLGLDVPHEAFGRDGSVSWPYAVMDSEYPWSPTPPPYYFNVFFHQVRHPLQVIASAVQRERRASWDFRRRHLENLEGLDLHTTAVTYWIEWNEIIEAYATWRYRVEDTSPVEVCQRAGFGSSRCDPSRVDDPSELVFGGGASSAASTHMPLSWSELKAKISLDLFHRLERRARLYGYTTSDDAESLVELRAQETP